jgi:hypothetical protein
MKKVFSSHSQLAHVWANQLQESGRASSMFFEGPVIYSYGYHYEIARFIDAPNGQKFCFVNANGYSNSTAKHTSHVINAIPDGIPTFRVPFVRNSQGVNNKISLETLPAVIDKIKENITDLLAKQVKARTDFRYFVDASNLLDDANEICQAFNIFPLCLVDFPLWSKAREKSVLIRETQNQREEQKRANQLQKDLENLDKWLNNEYNGTLYNLPVYFRLISDGKMVQTSRGAVVSKDAAVLLYKRATNGLNIRGEKIEGFSVLENNPDTIKIGCHAINWSIANEFFSRLTDEA